MIRISTSEEHVGKGCIIYLFSHGFKPCVLFLSIKQCKDTEN